MSFIEARNDNVEDIDISELDHPYVDGQVIYDDPENNFELIVKKKRHVRETNYLEDHLFEINIREKQKLRGQGRPLLVDLLLIFRTALIAFLNDLVQFYDAKNNHQMYITVIDDNIQHGLNTGNFNINTDPEIVTTNVLNMLYNFLTSHLGLRLSDSFCFNIKVLSLRHARDRVRKGNLNPHILNGSFQINRKKYLFFLPDGFDGYERVFSQNCLLLSIILGHYLNKSFEFEVDHSCRFFKQLSQINSEQAILRVAAGQKLLQEATKVCSKLSIDLHGPHCLEEIGPKLSKYYNEQLIVFDNFHFDKIAFKYPFVYDETRSQIYLYQELNDKTEGHISLIDKIRLFQRMNGTICMYCERVSHSSKPFLHLCKKRETCKSCMRYVQLPHTKINHLNRKLYCAREGKFPCSDCKEITWNEDCIKLHKCSGFTCAKCNNYIKKRFNRSFSDTKKIHQCGEFFCLDCKTFTRDIKREHICKLQKTTLDKNQPALGFFKLQIVDENNSDCYGCFEMKDLKRKELKLDWDQFIQKIDQDKKFQDDCLCDLHKIETPTKDQRYANLAVLKIETTTRGVFHTQVFADEEMTHLQNIPSSTSKHPQDSFTKTSMTRAPIPLYFGKSYRGTDIQQTNLEKMKKKENKSALEKLFSFLITSSFYNTTLLCFGAEEIMFAYKTFLDNGLECNVLNKGSKVLLLEYYQFQLRILDLSNYFSCKLSDLPKLFDLKVLPTYFPTMLNRKENYDILTLSPKDFPLHFYYNFSDDKEERQKKKYFWEGLQDAFQEWNFQEQLLENCTSQLEIVMQAAFKFIRQCETFQEVIRAKCKVTKNTATDFVTMPFARPFCTMTSYFYHIFKFYFMDPSQNFYIVPNEYPRKIQSSKEEKELAAFIQFMNPRKAYNNVFCHISERNFGGAIPDIYCKEDNAVWFFNECIIHGHDPNVCPITSKRKNKTCFGKSFTELDEEFRKKLDFVKQLPGIKSTYVVWQCQWRNEKRTNQILKQFIAQIYVPWPTHHISPREAVRGARIECFGLKWTEEANPDEKLYYVDCSSLYPFSG